MKVDWYAMTPEEQAEVVNEAPPVAGPWASDEWPADGEAMAVNEWSRVSLTDGHYGGYYAAWIMRYGDKWELQQELLYPLTQFDSAEEAKAFADAALTAAGWRLCK